jgi:hypothetical protein
VKSRSLKSRMISVIDRERGTWQRIKEFGNQKSGGSRARNLEFREVAKPEP